MSGYISRYIRFAHIPQNLIVC